MKEESIIDQMKKTAHSFLLEKEGVERKRPKPVFFDEDVHFENNTIYYKNEKFGKYDEKNRTISVDDGHFKTVFGANKVNPITGHPSLPSNCSITVKSGNNTHLFKTDRESRVYYQKSRIRGRFTSRINDQQTRAKRHKDEEGFVDSNPMVKDEGGHGQADSAGGLGEMINIFPQAKRVHRSIEWTRQEFYQQRMIGDVEIDFESDKDYFYEGKSKRPVQIRVRIKNNSNGNLYPKDAEYLRTFNNSNDINSEIVDNAELYRNDFEEELKEIDGLPIENSKKSKKILKKGEVERKIEQPRKKKRKFILLLLLLLLLILFFIFNPISFRNIEAEIDASNGNIKSVSNEKSVTSEIIEVEDLGLMFSKPLDTLTRSMINNLDIINTIKTNNMMPVIGVMFDYNSSILSENGKQVLDLFVDNYKLIKVDNYLIIDGFSCTVGSQNYNLILTNDRANTIKDYLTSVGMDETKLIVKPIGKANYVNEKGEEEDLVLNRRSNITIYSR